MKRLVLGCICLGWISVFLLSSAGLMASPSKRAVLDFDNLFLGKDVKALLDLPAYKDGLDLYVNPKSQKHLDERGIDLNDLWKFLKEKGVGVERDELVTITDVKVDNDRIEMQLSGGEGRSTSRNAGYKRPGGSRIIFRYGRGVTDADIQADAFLPLLGRVLDTSKIRGTVISKAIAPEFQEAVRSKDAVVGMTYQMVLTSLGEPDQKKVDDSTDDSLRETWYYMKDGHRWVVRFLNGKVANVQVF
jgi:hypothetical protein